MIGGDLASRAEALIEAREPFVTATVVRAQQPDERPRRATPR